MDHLAIVQDDGDAPEPADPLGVFELPFPVATLTDLGQRAYLNAQGVPEWLFSRAHACLKIQTDPGRLLRLNKAQIENELGLMQVPKEEFHYRGSDQASDQHWSDHTCESRCLLVVLLWAIKNRAMKPNSKVLALNLLLDLVAAALKVADLSQPTMAMLTTENGVLVSEEISFSAQGLCYSWGSFLRKCPGASSLWHKLTTRTWLNRCLSSSMDTATCTDVWFFLCYLYCHPKLRMLGQNLWLCVGMTVLPNLLWACGGWLVALAEDMCKQSLQMLPALRRKTGFLRRLADPVNKILLLHKLRREKQHRNRVARTHEELGGNTSRMMVYEAYVDCLLHMKALEAGFQGSQQVSVSWDPSSYGGKDINMAIAYDPVQNKAAYLMSQQMTQTMLSEIRPDLLKQAKARKLCRLAGFMEVKGLSSALESIGLSLGSFRVPSGLICRPLTATEFRLEGADGQFYIQNAETGEVCPEVPAGYDLGSLPCLVSISDQGPNITGASNFLQFSKGALLYHSVWDPFHRVWNDLKLAMKRSKASAWRVVLELTLVANLNYGPFNSSTWHWRKKAQLENFMAVNDISNPTFQKYLHLLCKERKMTEPSSHEDSQALFDSLASLDSYATKGPLIKLMRWFSWFESMTFYSGELFATKIIMEDGIDVQDADSGKEISEPKPQEHQDPQKELRELKKRKGCWKLAPLLINERTVTVKDVIMSIGKSCWQLFAQRARELLTPFHVLEYNISCSHAGFWKQEIVEIINTALYDERFQQHLVPEFCMHEKALEWDCDLLDKLLQTRSESLAVFNCLPPNLYHHILSPNPAVALKAHKLAIEHWKILLAAEEAANEGVDVRCLKVMHWRRNPLIRCLFMSFEQDEVQKQVFSDRSRARRLQRVIAQNLGDSRVIENVHQHGRDLFRASKANSISNTAIMSNALKSGVLEQRKVPMVSAHDATKALSSQWKPTYKESVVKSLKTKGRKMPPELQQMMVQEKGAAAWPSPAPGSLFQSAAATQWLFTYWNSKDQGLKAAGINGAWLSFLARPGAVVAQQSSGLMLKVLCSAEFGFLGVTLEVKVLARGRVYFCNKERSDVRWHYVWDLGDWIEVQVEPFLLLSHTGPVAYQLSGGPPMPLDTAACIYGHPMTFKQVSDLVALLGGVMPKKATKKIAMETLIDIVVPADRQDQAKAFLKVDETDDKGYDSEFSELISELGQDEANSKDLKEYKEKKQIYNRKRKLAAKDAPVPGKEKKAKAKPKAKGKPKAKPKKDLGEKWLRFAARKRAEQKKSEEDEAPNDPQPEPAVEVPVDPPPMPPPPQEPQEIGSKSPLPDEPPASPTMGPSPASESRPAASGSNPSAASSGAPPRERHRSPEEIMTILEPPGCKFGISFQDHRFTSVWKADHLRAL